MGGTANLNMLKHNHGKETKRTNNMYTSKTIYGPSSYSSGSEKDLTGSFTISRSRNKGDIYGKTAGDSRGIINYDTTTRDWQSSWLYWSSSGKNLDCDRITINAKHEHIVPAHAHGIENDGLVESGTDMAAYGNLPPYLCVYIWIRMEDDWDGYTVPDKFKYIAFNMTKTTETTTSSSTNTTSNTTSNPTKPSTGGGSSGGCFDTGTKVLMANGKAINIENVKVDDLVMSYNPKTGNMKAVKVNKVFKMNQIRGLVTLTFDDGTTLDTTTTHPFYTTKGWVSLKPDFEYDKGYEDLYDQNVSMMEIGQSFYKITRSGTIAKTKLVRIKYKQNILSNHIVYNLDVDGHNTFFTNGILGHNAKTNAFAQEHFVF